MCFYWGSVPETRETEGGWEEEGKERDRKEQVVLDCREGRGG